MSIALMNIATQMTPRPRQRLSSTPSCAGNLGKKWMKWGASMAAYPASARRRTRDTAELLIPSIHHCENAGVGVVRLTAELSANIFWPHRWAA
jgi:hypothetical protein